MSKPCANAIPTTMMSMAIISDLDQTGFVKDLMSIEDWLTKQVAAIANYLLLMMLFNTSFSNEYSFGLVINPSAPSSLAVCFSFG